jgi:hypothetical protein
VNKDSTNDVLREIIDELYRRDAGSLPERRMRMDSDHDLLIEIKATLNNNGRKLDDFISETRAKLVKHDSDIAFSNKIIYGAVGAFVLVEFILKVMK